MAPPLLEFPHYLLDGREPRPPVRAPALGRHLLENRWRQKLPVRALEDRRRFLQLPLQPLGGRQELGDDLGQRLARDVIGTGEQRRTPRPAPQALDVRTRQLAA